MKENKLPGKILVIDGKIGFMGGVNLSIKNISGNESIEEIHGPSKEGEQKRSSLSSGKAKTFLGWEPKIPIEEGLKLTYNWFRKNI